MTLAGLYGWPPNAGSSLFAVKYTLNSGVITGSKVPKDLDTSLTTTLAIIHTICLGSCSVSAIEQTMSSSFLGMGMAQEPQGIRY